MQYSSIDIAQANWQTLGYLLCNLPYFDSLDIRKEEETLKINIKAQGLDANATIAEGKLVDCGIPPKTNDLYDHVLIAQFFMLIQPEPTQPFYVRILRTMKGFVGLHEYEGGRKVLSLSNNEGLAVKFIVKDVCLDDLERYIKNPTAVLVVIHTTNTPFAGVIGHLILSIANTAHIRVGDEIFCVPPDNWTFLQNILPMF